MKSPCTKTALALMLCFVTGLFIPRADTEAGEQTLLSLPPSSGPAFQSDPFYSAVRGLVMRYYPDATFEKRGNRIRFASDTYTLVHSAASATDPWGMTSDASGIDCDISIVPGKASHLSPSAASASTSPDSTCLTSSYSPALGAHIEVQLTHAKDAPAGFVHELSNLINNFDSTVSR